MNRIKAFIYDKLYSLTYEEEQILYTWFEEHDRSQELWEHLYNGKKFSINSVIAEYINEHYNVYAVHDIEENEVKVGVTQHGEEVFFYAPPDRNTFFNESYFIPSREYVYYHFEGWLGEFLEDKKLYKPSLYKDIIDKKVDESYISKLFDELDEMATMSLIKHFVQEYIDYIKKWTPHTIEFVKKS